MHTQGQDANLQGSAVGGANAIATTTIAGVAGKKIRITFISAGFSGASPAAPAAMTVSDGVITYNFAVGAQGFVAPLENPMPFGTGLTVTLTLAAGGAGAIGQVALGGYADVA